MQYRYWEHLKNLFGSFQGKAEIDLAEWQKTGRWKDNPVRPDKLFDAIRKTFKPRAKKNNNMISLSTALFTRQKDNIFHASRENATHIYDILFDIDNDEFKTIKDSLTGERDFRDFFEKSREKLWKQTKDVLEATGFLPYATVVASGAGLHIHFFLSEITALSQNYNEIPYADLRQAIVDELVPLLGADPIPSQLQAKGKWIPGTPYSKLPFAVETEVLNDARDFLDLPAFYNLVWEIKNHEKTAQVSRYVGLLGEYVGPHEFVNGDGSIIVINKDFRMWVKEETGNTDGDGEPVYKFRPIHTGMAILPKYVVVNATQNDDDDSDVLYIVNAINAKEERLVNLPLSAFEASDKLQKHFVKHNIDFAVERNRRQIFSYVRTHSKTVYAVEIGRQKDMLVHYNFIYKYGKVWPAHKRIVTITTNNGEDEIYYIKGAESKRENEKDPRYSAEHPSPGGTTENMLGHMDKILANRDKNRLFVSWMATALVRDKILEHYKEMPNLNLYGEAGTGKTTLLDAAARIFNIREQTAHPTMHNLYRKQKDMKNMIITLDDFSDMDYYRDFLKDSVRSSIRPRRTEDGGIAFPEIRNSLMLTTNYAITDDAITNRMIKLFFNKSEIIEDRKAYSQFDNFIDENQLSIMLDLYEKVRNINWDEFRQLVDGLIEYGSEKINDVRIAKMYAIVCAIAQVTGIHEAALELFINVIEEETHTATDKRQLLDVIVDYAIHREKVGLGYVPENIPRKFVFSHQKFTRYLDEIKYDRNVTQKTVTREMAPYRNFIMSKRTTVKDVGHGVMYFIDFGNAVFREYFEEVKETQVKLRNDNVFAA